MKYLFKRDTFLLTTFIILVIALFLHNPLNTHIFNPIKISMTDFAFSDLAFSESHLKNTVDDRIVIVNIDTAGRGLIAKTIDHLESYHPKCVGLDILFPPKKDDGNAALNKCFERFSNIILCQTAKVEESSHKFSFSNNQFVMPDYHWGFVNFLAEHGDAIRDFPVYLENDQIKYENFVSEITKYADKEAYKKLIKRNNKIESINYQRTDSDYYMVSSSDILNDRADSALLKNKIILVGYVSGDPYNIQDKHFTPLNSKILGRSIPDMNGVIIHANILSMILDETYITKIPGWFNILIAVIVTMLHVAFLIRYYIRRHFLFHVAVKMVELVISALLFYFSILLLKYADLDIDFTWTLISIIIAVDVMYFYEAFAGWLNKKFSFRSVFSHHHKH